MLIVDTTAPRTVSPSTVLKAFLITAFLATGQWTMLSRLGAGVIAVTVLFVALELRPGWFEPRGWEPLPWSGWRALLPGAPSASAIVIGMIAAAPIWLHLLLTRHQEFGFGGDDPYHFSAGRAYALQLRAAGPALAALGAAVFLVTRRLGRGHATGILFLGLFGLSLLFPPHFVFGRYPATFYLLATPLNVAADVLHWRSPALANHLTNALSIPVWLFLIRPIVIGRWPDLEVLPVVGLLLFQKEVIYYFTDGLIEPWALVFWLTLAESLVALPAERRWVALVLIASAALIKELMVLLVPVVWLLTGGIDLRRRRIAWRTVAYTAALLAPFAVFYVLRRRVATVRPVGLGQWGDIAAAGRVTTFASALRYQFGDSGVILLAALWLAWLIGLYRLRRSGFELALHALLGVAALELVAFFFTDAISISYTAYSRYMLLPLFVVGSTFFVAGHRLGRAGRERTLLVVFAAIVALQAAPLAASLALDLRPDYARNSREWSRVPIYIPIRALVSQIPDLPGGDAVRRVKIVTFDFDTTLAPNVYPDLNARYALRGEQQRVDAVDCRCVAPQDAVLLGVEFRTLLAVADGNAGDPLVAAAERRCGAQLQATCVATRSVHHDDGTIVGTLGVGVR
jgi:hypothetical protein